MRVSLFPSSFTFLKNSIFIISLAFATMFHFPANLQAGESKQLRYSLLPGETIKYSTSTDIKQSIGEMQMNMGTIVSTNVETKVEAIEKNNATLSVSYHDTKITTSGMAMANIPDGTTNYDEFSDNNESLTLSERGEILTRALKSAKKSGKKNPMERNAQAAVKALGYMFTEFPEKPLKIGDKWVVVRNDTSGAKSENQVITSVKLQYTLANYTDTLGVPCALLQCKSLSSSMSGSLEIMGNSMNFEGDGSLAGKVYIELATGMTLTSNINNQIDMRISMGGQDGMILPIAVESHSSISRMATSTK